MPNKSNLNERRKIKVLLSSPDLAQARHIRQRRDFKMDWERYLNFRIKKTSYGHIRDPLGHYFLSLIDSCGVSVYITHQAFLLCFRQVQLPLVIFIRSDDASLFHMRNSRPYLL